MSGETAKKHCLSKFKALLESICAQYEAIIGTSDENDQLNEIWLTPSPLDLEFSAHMIHCDCQDCDTRLDIGQYVSLRKNDTVSEISFYKNLFAAV